MHLVWLPLTLSVNQSVKCLLDTASEHQASYPQTTSAPILVWEPGGVSTHIHWDHELTADAV